MTDPDSRYAGGTVDWGRFDIRALAGFLDEDLSPMWAQVAALWQIHDLAREHAASLRQARETIVRVWSPEVSQASAAYLEELDALIGSRDGLVEASSANAQALAGVLTVLEHAKGTVDDLHERWRRLDQVTSGQVAALGVLGSAAVITAGAAASLIQPGLEMTGNDAEKVKLTAKAQAVMRDADTAAYAYLPRMVIPAQVATDPGHGWVPVDPGPSGGGNTSSSGRTLLRPPMIPPPSPAAGLTDSAGGPVLTSDGLTRPDSGIGISPVDRPTENALGGPVPGSSWFVDTQRGKVLHTGGVIGVTSGQIGLGPSPASRPKPGDHPEAGRIDGTTESAGGLWGGGAGVGRSTDRRYQRRLPPETVWPLPRSVPQVLEPPPEREVIHDPGPGVIGIDR